MDILAEAVTIRDRSGQIVYANRAALANMGFESLQQLQRRSSQSVMEDYLVEDEQGRALSIEDVPSMRLMQDERAEPLLMRTVHRASGEVRWNLLKSTPMRNRRGKITAAVTVIEDVTAVKTAELHTRLLAESGRILASSLDYSQTLVNVANLAVPALADWCAVDLFDESRSREHVVTAHRDPTKRELAGLLRELSPQALDPQSPVSRVLRTGTSELFEEIPDEQLVRSARSEEHLRLLRQLKMRSAMIVPLRVPRRTLGVMTLVTAESRRRLKPEDVELAEQLGRRAAVAVENARLHTTLAGVAETLQKSLLPRKLPEVPGWDLASLYRPAGAEQRIDVGGDFYEVFDSAGTWLCLLGDVAGKGVSVAGLTALVRHGARFASRLEPQPGAILNRLDQELRQYAEGALCTALCARLLDDRLVLSAAGHPPALIVREDGQLREVPEVGPLLGAFEDARWSEETVEIADDELVVLYTDGVIETRGERERFGGERLRRLLGELAGAPLQEVLRRLEASLAEFRRGPQQDDVVVLALRRQIG